MGATRFTAELKTTQDHLPQANLLPAPLMSSGRWRKANLLNAEGRPSGHRRGQGGERLGNRSVPGCGWSVPRGAASSE